MRIAAALLIALAGPAAAQSGPRPLDFDSRVETLEWRDGMTIPLRSTLGASIAVIFSPGETVQAVLVGDPASLDVSVAPHGDAVLLRPLRQPANDILEVRTQLRVYRLRLVLGPPNSVAYAVRFSISAPTSTAASPQVPAPDAATAYALRGEQSLRPSRVSDDGTRTYIEWGPDQPLPAVFGVNALGEEETIDAYVRDGVMVIDRVYNRLVFRMGKRTARADRREAKR